MLAGKFKAYTKGVGKEAVGALFEQRHGYRPAEVHDAGTIWLAGPIRDNGKAPSLLARVEAQRPMTPERARQIAMKLEGGAI